ncbi:MAG: hypothetical protein JJ869_21425 [Marivita sp.]|uniref:hypothetical protein n=1 Tax=Marivita sp. TaxID=2003365 RepID=UPI001B29F64E|nr:hypothetical protein [Marivita sp.]MBO6886115.1 hypothetical protein [Marivita sp.]
MTKASDNVVDSMPVLHLKEGPDGLSRFSDLHVPLSPGGFAPLAAKGSAYFVEKLFLDRSLNC